MDRDERRVAVEGAYADHAAEVYRVAYAILGDADAAEDATQDASAKAFEHWDRYDVRRPIRPWLHAIVARTALDAVRQRRVRRLALPRLVDRGRAPGADPTELAIDRRLVEEAMSALRPEARAALVLHHVYGYGYEEIGRILRLSPGGVGSLLSRARTALRADLGDRLLPTQAGADRRTVP